MSKTIRAADDIGRSWIIYEGDPAWGICQSLDRAGVTWVVLPAQVLLTGEIEPLDREDFSSPELIRLRDCVAWLRENYQNE